MRPLLLALLALLAPLALAQEGLTVQSEWRVAVATVAWENRYAARDVVLESERYVERELPGVDWVVAEGTLEVPLEAAWGEDGFEAALEKAIRPGDLPAGCDLVFVYTPFAADSRFFGYALQRFRPGGDPANPPVWYAVVNNRPDRVAIDRTARAARENGLLDEQDSRRAAARLSDVSRRLLAGSRILRHALVLTTVHEFGHFLSPGDKDVDDGIDGGWLQNGSPVENPDAHGSDCIMYNAPSPDSILAKATKAFPDGIRYCDRCRERLGIPR